jgi:hypothetical protein
MNKEIKKLLRWYDKKTGNKLYSYNMMDEILNLKKVPPSMCEGLRAFKKCNWNTRIKLVNAHIWDWHYSKIKK